MRVRGCDKLHNLEGFDSPPLANVPRGTIKKDKAMNEKFEAFMLLVGSKRKGVELRALFNGATTVGKLELLGTLEAFFTRF